MVEYPNDRDARDRRAPVRLLSPPNATRGDAEPY